MLSNNATSSVTSTLDQAVVALANAGSTSAALHAATVTRPQEARSVTGQGQAVECSWIRAF